MLRDPSGVWAAVTPSHGKPRHTAHGCPAEGHTSGRITEWASCPRQKYRGLGARSGRAPPLGQPQQVVSTAAFEGRAFKGANARLVPTRNRNVRHEGTAACPPSPAGTTLQLHHRPPPPPPLGSDSSRLFTGCHPLDASYCTVLLYFSGGGNGDPLQCSCLENPIWAEEPGGYSP